MGGAWEGNEMQWSQIEGFTVYIWEETKDLLRSKTKLKTIPPKTNQQMNRTKGNITKQRTKAPAIIYL